MGVKNDKVNIGDIWSRSYRSNGIAINLLSSLEEK